MLCSNPTCDSLLSGPLARLKLTDLDRIAEGGRGRTRQAEPTCSSRCLYQVMQGSEGVTTIEGYVPHQEIPT